jgi:hypothetical protein
MLRSATTVKGCKLISRGGEVGTVRESYFDDQRWAVRYLLADLEGRGPDNHVLISPHTLAGVIEEGRHIAIEVTTEQIESSPILAGEMPLTWAYADTYGAQLGWPVDSGIREREARLRGASDVNGYGAQAVDGECGHVEDLVIDDETWEIRYLVVGTPSRWRRRQVLVAAQSVERISRSESKVFVKLSRETILQSPECTDEALLERAYETRLCRLYTP